MLRCLPLIWRVIPAETSLGSVITHRFGPSGTVRWSEPTGSATCYGLAIYNFSAIYSDFDDMKSWSESTSSATARPCTTVQPFLTVRWRVGPNPPIQPCVKSWSEPTSLAMCYGSDMYYGLAMPDLVHIIWQLLQLCSNLKTMALLLLNFPCASVHRKLCPVWILFPFVLWRRSLGVGSGIQIKLILYGILCMYYVQRLNSLHVIYNGILRM